MAPLARVVSISVHDVFAGSICLSIIHALVLTGAHVCPAECLADSLGPNATPEQQNGLQAFESLRTSCQAIAGMHSLFGKELGWSCDRGVGVWSSGVGGSRESTGIRTWSRQWRVSMLSQDSRACNDLLE